MSPTGTRGLGRTVVYGARRVAAAAGQDHGFHTVYSSGGIIPRVPASTRSFGPAPPPATRLDASPIAWPPCHCC